VSTPTGPLEGFPEPGERIGPYEIVRQLGMGGMGVVFEAVDSVLKRRVALKIISPHLAGDPAFRVRFTQEAQAQASLDSPHVVQVFAHGEADPSTGSGGTGALYIASQLIPDGDLGGMIQASGAPPPRIALDILAQIAAGLADAHAMGLVHRDIKPANILLRLRGEEVSAYLADFGIARRTDIDPALSQTLSNEGFAIGTPSYMAPELHTGGTPGTTTDVYSLGCLLWAALSGRAPYSGTTDHQLAQAHLSAPIPQLAASGPFEREVNRILRTAMAKHPADRYPSAAALRDDLRRVLGATAPRTDLLVAVGIAVVVLIAVLGTVLALRAGDGGGDAASRRTGPSDDGLTAGERRAADDIAAALEADSNFAELDAECTAHKLVERSGVDGLQEEGIIDEDLSFVDNGIGVGGIDPQVLADIITLGVGCALESADIPVPT
jgi:hypothetical protein